MTQLTPKSCDKAVCLPNWALWGQPEKTFGEIFRFPQKNIFFGWFWPHGAQLGKWTALLRDLGSYHFLPGRGVVCLWWRVANFSWSPLCIRKKIWSPLAYGEKFWSPLWLSEKNTGVKIMNDVSKKELRQRHKRKKKWEKILVPPSLTLKKIWSPFLAHWKKTGPPPLWPPLKILVPPTKRRPPLPVKNDSSLRCKLGHSSELHVIGLWIRLPPTEIIHKSHRFLHLSNLYSIIPAYRLFQG